MQKFKEEKGASSIIVLLIIIIILLFAIASVLIIGIRNGKIQLKNKEENKTITQSDDEEDDSYLKCLGKTDDGGYLYVDKYSNKKILDFYQYDICYNTRAVEKDSKYSLEKIDGTIVVNPGVYDRIKKIHATYSGKYYLVTKDSKYGIIDYEGKVIIPLEYNMILEDFIDGEEKRSENVVFICNKKEETNTEDKVIIFNSSGSRVYECENQAEDDYYNTIERKYFSMDNGVSIMAVRNKISGEAYLINITSLEILEKYDKIDGISGGLPDIKNYISISNDNRALVVEKKINNKLTREMYFFNKEKKKSLTIDCEGYSISGSPYYYLFYDFKKTIVYNEFGEKVKELNGYGYVYNSKINPKTYFKLDNTLYDEQFKEMDSGNITECTGNHYLKDGIVYTMDKQEVAKDVDYLSGGFIRTKDDKKYFINGTDKIELASNIRFEWNFIGSNNEYFLVRGNNQIVIYKSDGLKELWRIEADSKYYVDVDNKCNVIKVGKKYYNFKGEELYEEK